MSYAYSIVIVNIVSNDVPFVGLTKNYAPTGGYFTTNIQSAIPGNIVFRPYA